MGTPIPNHRNLQGVNDGFKDSGWAEDDDSITDSNQNHVAAYNGIRTDPSHQGHIQSTSLSTLGFDPYAYGHPPSKPPKVSAKTTIANPPQIEPKNVSREHDGVKASYETLKLAGETREQTLQRLQQKSIQKIQISTLKANDKHGLQTTNLAELKALRAGFDNGGQQPSVNGVTSSSPADVQSSTVRTTQPLLKAAVHHTSSSAAVPNGHLHPPLRSFPLAQQDVVDQKSRGQSQADQPCRPPRTQGQQQFPVAGVPPSQADIKRQHKNWIRPSDIKAPAWSLDSNAARSETDFGSTLAMEAEDDAEFGRMIRKVKPGVRDSPLVGWDGGFQPPPVDWEQRVRFQIHTDNAEHRQWLRDWLNSTIPSVFAMRRAQVPDIEFIIYPEPVVLDLANHADGIGFVSRDTTVNASNGLHYGFDFRSDTFFRSSDAVADFDGDCSMDLSIPDNVNVKDETTNMYIRSKTAAVCRENQGQEEAFEVRRASRQLLIKPVQESPRPKANFYLRPAVRADVPGIMAIYNWHITNGVRPSELNRVGESEIHQRMDMAQQSRLPIIVAVERGRGNARKKTTGRPANPTHPIQNVDPTYSGVVKDEHVIGWASATDWSCADYVECITADLECYVAGDFRRKGVGRCLMDALLDATDRGYAKAGGYDFHAAQEVLSFYTCGGVRGLTKLIVQVRLYSKPISPEDAWERSHPVMDDHPFLHGGNPPQQTKPRPSKPDFSPGTKIDDREDDYQVWLKGWLQGFGFKQEACIEEIGTKNRRYLDLRYMTRRTAWRQNEGALPDYQESPISSG